MEFHKTVVRHVMNFHLSPDLYPAFTFAPFPLLRPFPLLILLLLLQHLLKVKMTSWGSCLLKVNGPQDALKLDMTLKTKIEERQAKELEENYEKKTVVKAAKVIND